MRKNFLLFVALLAVAGCSLSHKAVRKQYLPYNETIHYNQSQEMLLNLVRLRYRETPMFFKVGALSTSYNFEASAGASFGRSSGRSSYGLNVGSGVASRPTITYTPIEGNTFVRQILAEVDPNTFVLLFRSGWPIDLLCYLLVEEIAGTRNNEEDLSFPDFQSMVARFQEAQEDNSLDFVKSGEDLFLEIRQPADEPPSSLSAPGSMPLASFQLRSFLDIMFYLAKNTEVPPQHSDRVKPSIANNWLSISSSDNPPPDALVWIEHEGFVFSISDRDIKSKDTFAFLKLLFQIQAGDISTVQPLLTLPVARP